MSGPLLADFQATQVAFKCLGWVLRRLFAIKDNYFGSYTNFTTFSEFNERFAEDPKLVGDRVEEKYRPGRVRLVFTCAQAHCTAVRLVRCESHSASPAVPGRATREYI